MTTLNPYLAFEGNCEEAMNFYAECLGGEVSAINRYKDMPDSDPALADKVMHGEVTAGDIRLMFADTLMPHFTLKIGNHISLSINLTDENTQTQIFNKLAEGGQVTMPLENTFWGARFGMLIDKYGFAWMLNCTQPEAAAQ